MRLLSIRSDLQSSRTVDLSATPFVCWEKQAVASQMSASFAAMSTAGTVVALHNQPQQCYNFARRLGGRYGVMEEFECTVLKKLAVELDRRSGPVAARALLDFARLCASGWVAPLDTSQLEKLGKGIRPTPRAGGKATSALEALSAVLDLPDAVNIMAALTELEGVAGIKVFRREAWNAARRTIELARRSPGRTFGECAVVVRNRVRVAGRALQARTVSRTLLVKGLEYDTCVLLDADGMSTRNLYVALTRARQKLVVLSQSPLLSPSKF